MKKTNDEVHCKDENIMFPEDIFKRLRKNQLKAA